MITAGLVEDPVREAARLVEAAASAGLPLRVLGGVAISLHAADLPAALQRPYQDIDLICGARDGDRALELLKDHGYVANDRFNALQGHRRLVVYDPRNDRHVDVFVGRFEMCHPLPIAERLGVDCPTIPLAELLLTKLQIRALNHKDAHDALAVLATHDVADHDDDAINGSRIGQLLAEDWGLWRTCRDTLQRLRDALPASGLDPATQTAVTGRLDQLAEAIESTPKPIRWRARARIGDRARWYEEPEEIDHGSVGT